MPFQKIFDTKIYYEITGSGTPVLLVHGLGSSTQDWEKQIAFFSLKFQVIAMDLRGYGRSSRNNGPFDIHQFSADTAEFVQKLGIGPVHLVGISMGGMVAFQLALDRPELIDRLVIINSVPEFTLSSFKAHWEIWQRFFMTRVFGMAWTGKVIGKRLFPAPGQRELRETFARRWARNDPDVYMASIRGIVNWSVRKRLTHLQCPTLVVAGEKDFIPLEVKKEYVKEIPGAEMVVLQNSGHASPADKADEFNQRVLEFLSRKS